MVACKKACNTASPSTSHPQGGQLTVETATVELGEADAPWRVGVILGRYVRLAGRATGIGRDAATPSHLCEPVLTTTEPDQGTGLGLAPVYGMVTQRGGHITVDSPYGRGTTFRMSLPRFEAGLAAVEPAAPPSTRGSGSAWSLPTTSVTVTAPHRSARRLRASSWSRLVLFA